MNECNATITNTLLRKGVLYTMSNSLPNNQIVDESIRQSPKVPIGRLSLNRLQEIVEPILVSKKPILTNWGGTFQCQPRCLFQPKTVEECCAIIELARRMGNIECRALGRGHSPGDLPFTTGWQIQMKSLKGLVNIDSVHSPTGPSTFHPSITVMAGTYVSDMHSMLENATVPLAMSNLGSISEQTIAGLLSTASHGTGFKFPVLSANVESLRIICALSEQEGGTQVVECDRIRQPELFNASLCGLGATGLIVECKIKVDYWFKLKQISEECKFDDLIGLQTDTPSIATVWNSDDEGIRESFEARGAKKAIQKAKQLIVGSNEEETNTIPIKRPISIGKLLAHQPHLIPGCPQKRLPRYRSQDPSQIYPIEYDQTQDEEEKRELDEETLKAQLRLESLAKSSQHVRIAWVPQAGMCTLMRMNKTLEPIQAPGTISKMYGKLVGYHFVQILLFLARYRPSMLPDVVKFTYWLTHPSKPKQSIIPNPTFSPSINDKSESQGSLVKDPITFANGTFDPSQLAAKTISSSGGRSFYDPEPINKTNPISILVDVAPKVFNFDCLFQQYTNEWAIPLSSLAMCLRSMRDWFKEEIEIGSSEQIHFPVEIRFVDADGIWLSSSNGRKTVYIGIVQYRPYNLSIKYKTLFEKFEILMRYFGGRPHWAKAHTCGPMELQRLYPNLTNFVDLIQNRIDPDGIFLNPYTKRHLLGDLRQQSNPRIFKARI